MPASNVFSISYALLPAPVPQTGQTTSYAAGDDGNLRMGLEWPTPRFTDNGDQTMTDNLTGLIWTKDGKTPCPAACTPGVYKTWQGALDYVTCVNSNNYLGKNDWRLPNINELSSLVNWQQYTQAVWLNGQGFSNVQSSSYWSSSNYADSTGYAWHSMRDGYVGYNGKSYYYYVWPVRGGQFWFFDSLTVYGDQAFGNRRIETLTASLQRQAEIANRGNGAATISSITITGADAGEFSVAPGGNNPCPSLAPTLAAGASCTVQVTFTPVNSIR